MKIFVSHTRDFDFENELYQPIRTSELNNQHAFFLPHEDDRNVKTKEEIEHSDLFIAEASFPTTGSGIEIGWADAAGVPILVIYKEGYQISGSLKYLTDKFIEYSSAEDLINKLTVFLENGREE